MTRWDEKEEQQSKGISGVLFFAIIVFAIGFVIGVLWGLSMSEAALTPIPPVFGWDNFMEIQEPSFIGPPDYKTSFEVLEQYRALMNGEVLTSSLTKTVHITLYDGIGVSDSIVTSP